MFRIVHGPHLMKYSCIGQSENGRKAVRHEEKLKFRQGVSGSGRVPIITAPSDNDTDKIVALIEIYFYTGLSYI